MNSTRKPKVSHVWEKDHSLNDDSPQESQFCSWKQTVRRLSLEGIFTVCFWDQRGQHRVGYHWKIIETEIVLPFPNSCNTVDCLNMDHSMQSPIYVQRPKALAVGQRRKILNDQKVRGFHVRQTNIRIFSLNRCRCRERVI